MSEKEQIAHFAQDLDNLITRYRQEYELSVASAVGVLEIVKHDLIREHMEDDLEED